MEQTGATPIGSSPYGCDVHTTNEKLRTKFQFHGAAGMAMPQGYTTGRNSTGNVAVCSREV